MNISTLLIALLAAAASFLFSSCVTVTVGGGGSYGSGRHMAHQGGPSGPSCAPSRGVVTGGGGRFAQPPQAIAQMRLRTAPPSNICWVSVQNGCRIYTEIRSGRQIGWMPAPGYSFGGSGHPSVGRNPSHRQVGPIVPRGYDWMRSNTRPVPQSGRPNEMYVNTANGPQYMGTFYP